MARFDTPGSLVVEGDGAVVTVTLNRPDDRNSFDEELKQAFPNLLAQIDRDRDVRAVVLTGAGRSFCAGGNLEEFEMYRVDFEARRQAMRDARRLLDGMLGLKVPVVAAVNGAAVGLGCTIASTCDIVFMAESAYLADPHVSVALVAGDGGAVTWPFLTSMLKVKQYFLTGDRVPAVEAAALGLANFVVPPDELMGAAVAFAERLAALPPQAVQDTKSVLNQFLRQAAVSVLGVGLATESQSHDTAAYLDVTRKLSEGTR